MPRFTTTGLVTVGLTLAVFATTGCSGGSAGSGSTAPAPPALTAVPTPTSLAGIGYPLDDFRQNAQQSQTVAKATGLLMVDCMRRLGFVDFQAPKSTPLSDTAVKQQQDGPGDFGYLDATRAARYGFHDPATAGSGGKSAGAGPGETANPAELAALTGVRSPGGTVPAGRQIPPGGCTGEASRALRGTGQRTSLSSDLINQAYARVTSDSRVAAAVKAWSTCMSAAGFSYSAPGDLATEAWASTPTRSEIATAKADVACTRKTDLAGIALAVQTAVEKQLVAGNLQALQEEKARNEAAVRRADRVIREHGA